MTEVTWHGKGNEDKRGNPITENIMAKVIYYLRELIKLNPVIFYRIGYIQMVKH